MILSLTMGFVFGRWVGTALVVVAATVGATIVFLAARYIFADAARKRLGALGEKINAGFTENAFNYMLFLRLVPAFPFFLVNLAPAFTSIPLRTFVLATFIGIIPGTFVFVNLGETLGRIDSLQGLVSVADAGRVRAARPARAGADRGQENEIQTGTEPVTGRNRMSVRRMPRHVLATCPFPTPLPSDTVFAQRRRGLPPGARS